MTTQAKVLEKTWEDLKLTSQVGPQRRETIRRTKAVSVNNKPWGRVGPLFLGLPHYCTQMSSFQHKNQKAEEQHQNGRTGYYLPWKKTDLDKCPQTRQPLQEAQSPAMCSSTLCGRPAVQQWVPAHCWTENQMLDALRRVREMVWFFPLPPQSPRWQFRTKHNGERKVNLKFTLDLLL